MQLTITQIDTACLLIDLNGFRILTDPAFDAAGGSYQSGSGRVLHKIQSPAIRPEDIGPVDLEIAARYTIDTAILHIGRAGFPALIGDRYLTFSAAEAIRTARLMNVNKLIPTHREGWEHFVEKASDAHKQVVEAGLEDKLVWLEAGKPATISI